MSRGIAAAIGDRTGRIEVGDWLAQVSPPSDGVPFTVVVTQNAGLDSSTTGLFLLILLAGALVAAVLVTVVVRGLSQPLTDLTEAAERVVQGDLDTRIAPTTDDSEVGRLSEAFNVITSDLRQNMSALEKSRADLSVSLQKIGETLTNTHDLDGLLEVVLDTAVVTLQARAGVVLYGAPEQMHVVADSGMHEAGLVAPAGIAPGVGVLGRVVTSGEAVRGPLGSGAPELEPATTEPGVGNVFAVPLRSMGNVVGVLALYDRVDGKPFDEGDVESLGTLSTQASIAMDNVQLHQEAQRLSTTDALTGLWNFRYLSSSLGREIERANRFERPLAVLMLDIDHFKQVNDQHGHARGDTVLRELAHRVQEQIREVDTFARYGGEEFVVVLPETTVEGATQLAERICVAVRREPFRAEGEESLKVTVSVGGAAFPAHGSSAATLMRAADRALYVAKNEGRDRWHVPETLADARVRACLMSPLARSPKRWSLLPDWARASFPPPRRRRRKCSPSSTSRRSSTSWRRRSRRASPTCSSSPAATRARSRTTSTATSSSRPRWRPRATPSGCSACARPGSPRTSTTPARVSRAASATPCSARPATSVTSRSRCCWATT